MSLLSQAIVDPGCIADGAPPLGVLLYQQFTYGFLTVLLTKRFGLSNFGWAVVTFLIANIGWHFADGPLARMDFIIFTVLYFVLGMIPGAALSVAGNIPRLLNLDVLQDSREQETGVDRRAFAPEPLLLWASAIFGFLAASFFAHRWSSGCLLIDPETETILGWIFAALTALILLSLSYYAFCPLARPRDSNLCSSEYGHILENQRRLKYMVVMVALSAVPHAIIDFSFLGGFAVYYGAVAVAALAFTYLCVYAYIVNACRCTWLPYKSRLPKYDGLISRYRVMNVLLATGIFHCGSLLAIYLVELLSDHSLVHGVIAATVASLLGAIIFIALGEDLQRLYPAGKYNPRHRR